MEVQNSDLSSSEYKHKKFSKRPRNDSESTQSCSGSSTISADISEFDFNPATSTSGYSSEEVDNPPAKIRIIDYDTNASSSHQEEDDDDEDSLEIQSIVPEEKILEVCKFHPNMVRKFPPKARSKEDQERRDKNTVACRITRRAKKLEVLTLEEEYEEMRKTHEKVLEWIWRAEVFLNKLKEKAGEDSETSDDIKESTSESAEESTPESIKESISETSESIKNPPVNPLKNPEVNPANP